MAKKRPPASAIPKLPRRIVRKKVTVNIEDVDPPEDKGWLHLVDDNGVEFWADPNDLRGNEPDFKAGEVTVFDEAKDIVYGARQAAYGHPIDNFTHIANMWSAYLNHEIKPRDVPALFIMSKMSRETNVESPSNRVDIVGYGGTWQRLYDDRSEEEPTDG